MFVGTSRIYRTTVPDVIDAALTGEGCSRRSYNFGVEGLNGVEFDRILESILAHPPQNLRWIVVDGPLPSLPIELDNFINRRARYFYDVEHIPIFWQSIMYFLEKIRWSLARIRLVIAGYIYEYGGIGKLSQILPAPVAAESPSIYNENFEASRGYMPLSGESHSTFQDRGKAFHPERGWVVRDRQRVTDVPDDRSDARAAFLARYLGRIANSGINPVLLELPQERPPATSKAIIDGIVRRVSNVRVLNYNRIDRFPEFFDPALWFDVNHFTDKAARLMSARIGADLCQMMKAAKTQPGNS